MEGDETAEGILATNEEDDEEVQIGPYPSYTLGPFEILLVVLLFVLWFYSVRRIYKVWSNVLNFSEFNSEQLNRAKGNNVQNVKLQRKKNQLNSIIHASKILK